MNNGDYLFALLFCAGPEDPTFKFVKEETVESDCEGLPLVVVCANEHLEQVFEHVTELSERAMQGDRLAEKELKFAERYGMKPPFLEFHEPVDLEKAERRIEQFYRDQGIEDGQFKNHGSTTGRRSFD